VQVPVNNAKLPGASTDTVLGDTRVDLKYGVTEEKDSGVSFSLMPEITFPTGSQQYFLTDNGVTAGLLLVAEKTFDAVRIVANLGYRYSQNADYLNINYHNRIPFGLGTEIKLARKWSLSPEFSGFLATPLANHQNPGEFYLGANFHPQSDLAVMAGASAGTADRQASLNYRFIFGVRMYLTKPAHAAELPPPAPPPPPPPPVAPVVKPKPRVVFTNTKIETLDMVNFENDKDVLTSSGKTVLDDVARVVEEHKAAIAHLSIEGHTSHTGTQKHNDELSLRRAKRVKEYLSAKGVDPAIMSVKGYGWQRPKYLLGKATKEELELNRRVEFIITPKK
jgi:outer membrane protein OmpA-like peptidoglycan-associated protein